MFSKLFQVVDEFVNQLLFPLQVLFFGFLALNLDDCLELASELFIAHLS